MFYKYLYIHIVGWLGFMAYQPLLVIKCQIHFYAKTIQFNMSTQFNCQKHFYFKLFDLVKHF